MKTRILILTICLLSVGEYAFSQLLPPPLNQWNKFPAWGNVGIGTTNPTEELDVRGEVKVSETIYTHDLETVGLKANNITVSQDLSVTRNLLVSGNVGIGVPNPTEKLEINGNLKVSNSIFANALTITQFTSNDGTFNNNLLVKQNFNVNGLTGLGVASPSERLEVLGNVKATQGLYSDLISTGEGSFSRNVQITQNLSATDGLFSGNIKSNQNLVVDGLAGIGVASPSEKLEVAGNIKATQGLLANSAQITQNISAGGNLAINGTVGIGIAPGADKLTVGGSAYVNGLLTAENLTVKQKLDIKGTFSLAGTMGIGVANPEAALHVNGDGKFDGDIRANKIIVNAIEIAGATQTPGGGSSVSLGDNLFVNGSIGIGTTKTEGFKLSVNGKIRASDIIKVYPENQWSDFVFEKNYKLLSLEEVERYIKKHGHLPEIPSAKEVAKDGIDLGSMDAKLLQKIEELTLYMIEMKKTDELLRQENQRLKKEIRSIKSSVTK